MTTTPPCNKANFGFYEEHVWLETSWVANLRNVSSVCIHLLVELLTQFYRTGLGSLCSNIVHDFKDSLVVLLLVMFFGFVFLWWVTLLVSAGRFVAVDILYKASFFWHEIFRMALFENPVYCCASFLCHVKILKRCLFEFLSPLLPPPLVRNDNSCAKRESSCRTGSHCRRSSSSQSWSSPPTRGCSRTSCLRAVGESQNRRLVPARHRGPVPPLLLRRRRRRGEEETGASRGRGWGKREKKSPLCLS